MKDIKTFGGQTLRIFWNHAKKYRWQTAFLIVSILAVELMQTLTPLLYRNLINLLAGGPTKTIVTQALHLVILIFILNIVRIGWWRALNFVTNFYQPRIMADLTNTCYRYLLQHSYNFFSSSFVGSLVTKVKRYERAFEQICDQIMFDLGRSLIDTTMILVVMLIQYRAYGLIVLGWCVLFLLFSYLFSIFKLPYDIKRADADTQMTAQLADSLTNNTNIKIFGGYNHENQRFADVIQNQFFWRKKSWDLATVGDVVQSTLMLLLEFGIIYYAVHDWSHNRLSIGDIVLLQGYVLRISDKLWNTGKNMRTIYEALADGNEMTEILHTPFEIADKPGAGTLSVSSGTIEFKDVTFGYHTEKHILNNFNLSIPAGQRVALIGPSGGGKTTITKLLFRFADLQSGSILIDSQNIANITQESLRAQMSIVPQESILFHRSLTENIRYARPDATHEEVIRAAKLAHCHEFISKFPDQYETLVGERGIKLSGGERQRVAIARAILKNAPILVLDEATSSLDSESEMFIQDALKTLMKDKTTIVIAHRLSTIMQMDRIVVIEKGKITEEGKHEELVKATKGTYQKLWEIQAGGFAG